jgi:hypothetical protein
MWRWGAAVFTVIEATFHPLRTLLLATLIVLLAFHPW